jgi:hypothetical protein
MLLLLLLIDDLGEYESDDCAKFSDGIWTLSDQHRLFLVDAFPEINNRSYVFQRKDDGNGFLLVIGVVASKAVKGLQKLIEETNIPVLFVVCQASYVFKSLV